MAENPCHHHIAQEAAEGHPFRPGESADLVVKLLKEHDVIQSMSGCGRCRNAVTESFSTINDGTRLL